MFNVIQYDDGLRPIYQQCMDQARSRMPQDINYSLITKTECEARYIDYRAVSDVIRLKYAASDPNMVWLDTDILIKKWPDFEFKKGKTYINDSSVSVIFVNGCTEFYKHLWDIYQQTEELNYSGWFQRLILKHKEIIEYIPTGYFAHCALSHAIFAGEGFTNYGNTDFTITKKDGELSLKVNFK
jgi:hypothetical protein